MLHAMEVGKVTAGDARPKLSSLRKELEQIVGMEVDVSVIRKGSEFDVGTQLRIQ